jgi:hypothetical protein
LQGWNGLGCYSAGRVERLLAEAVGVLASKLDEFVIVGVHIAIQYVFWMRFRMKRLWILSYYPSILNFPSSLNSVIRRVGE